MRRIILLILVVISFTNLNAQNIPCFSKDNMVLNPDFENYIINSDDSTKVVDWFQTPYYINMDYWNKNVTSDFYNLLEDEKDPHSSVEFVGFVPLSWSGFFQTLVGKLKSPLVKDKYYEVQMWIMSFNGDTIDFKLRKIEAKFSEDKYVFGDSLFFTYESVLLSLDKKIKSDISFKLDDNNFWQCVKAVYKAKGGEKYISIGIFYNKKFSKDVFKFERFGDSLYNSINNPLNIGRTKFFKEKNYLIYSKNTEVNINKCSLFEAYYLIDCISVIEIEK